MNTAIICSLEDPAGRTIKKQLLELGFSETKDHIDADSVYERNGVRLITVTEGLLEQNNLDQKIISDLIIFASRHRSLEGKPSFTCHAPGNWGPAEFGGVPSKLCKTSALALRSMLMLLKKHAAHTGHEVTLEVTHHGPYIETPCLFVELGSTEKEWANAEYARVVAVTILDFLDHPNTAQCQIAVALGGTHYAPNIVKCIERAGIATSHVCPKHALQHLSKDMLRQSIEKTKEHVDFVLVDWKGLGGEKARIKDMLAELNLEWKRTDKTGA